MEIWLVHIEYDRMNDRISTILCLKASLLSETWSTGCFQNGYVKYFSSGMSGINCICLQRKKKTSNFNPVIYLPVDFSSNINRSHFLFPISVDLFCLFASCVCRLLVTPFKILFSINSQTNNHSTSEAPSSKGKASVTEVRQSRL